MELDTTPVPIKAKVNPYNKMFKIDRTPSEPTIPRQVQQPASFRERGSEFDKHMSIKFKEIKRDYNFYQMSLTSLKKKIQNGTNSLQTWELLTEEYEKMYGKYERLANLMIKKITENASQLKIKEDKYRAIEDELRTQTNEFIDTQERLATFQDTFLDMYDVFRIYMFSTQNVDIGNDLCNLQNQISALKDYFLIQLDEYTIDEKSPGGANQNLNGQNRHSLNSLRKKSQIGSKKEEISYNLSTMMNSNHNALGVKNKSEEQEPLSNYNNLVSNLKVITNNRSHMRQQDSHNMSFFDQILNNNILHNHESGDKHDPYDNNDFNVMNSMNMGLNDTQNQLTGILRNKSNHHSNNYSFQIGSSGVAGMNPHDMPKLKLSGIKSVHDHFGPEHHDSAIKSVREQIEEMTSNKKESQFKRRQAMDESIVTAKEISNLEELSEMHKRKSERVIRNVSSSNGKVRSISQFGKRRPKAPGESSTFKVSKSDKKLFADFENKMNKLDEKNKEENVPEKTNENSAIHNVYNNRINSINNSFDPMTFQSKDFQKSSEPLNPINEMSNLFQDVIRRTQREKSEDGPGPLDMTRGIDDILGVNGSGMGQSGKEDGMVIGDQSYNVLIGFEDHDFDYPSKERNRINPNLSENSFQMPNNSFQEDAFGLEAIEESGHAEDKDEQDEGEPPINDFQMTPNGIGFSHFEDAKPNIETPSERETPNPELEDTETNGTPRTEDSQPQKEKTEQQDRPVPVSKSSLEETPRNSNMVERGPLEEDELNISSKKLDDITVSDEDQKKPNDVYQSSLEESNTEKDSKARSIRSIGSEDLERESQREIASNIMDYITNGTTTDNVEVAPEKDETERDYGEEEQADVSLNSKEQSVTGESVGTPSRRNRVKRSQSESIQILANSSEKDIIFERNRALERTKTSKETLGNFSTTAGTIVAESMNQNNMSENKFENLRDKFKKKSSGDRSQKRDQEKLEELRKNRKKPKKEDDGKKKRPGKTEKKGRQAQTLYRHSRSKG